MGEVSSKSLSRSIDIKVKVHSCSDVLNNISSLCLSLSDRARWPLNSDLSRIFISTGRVRGCDYDAIYVVPFCAMLYCAVLSCAV